MSSELSIFSFGQYLSNAPTRGVLATTPLALTGSLALGASALAYKASSSRTIIGAAAVAVTATACFVNILRLARDAVALQRAEVNAYRSRAPEFLREEPHFTEKHSCEHTDRADQLPKQTGRHDASDMERLSPFKGDENEPWDAKPNHYFQARIHSQMVGTVATLLVVGAGAVAFARLALLGINAAAAGGKQIPVPVVLHSAVASVIKPLMTPKV